MPAASSTTSRRVRHDTSAMGNASSQPAVGTPDSGGESGRDGDLMAGEGVHEDDIAASSQIIQESRQERTGSSQPASGEKREKREKKRKKDKKRKSNGDDEVEVEEERKRKKKERKERKRKEIAGEDMDVDVVEETQRSEDGPPEDHVDEGTLTQQSQSKKRKRKSKDAAPVVEATPIPEEGMEDIMRSPDSPNTPPVIQETPQPEEYRTATSSWPDQSSAVPDSQTGSGKTGSSKKLKKIKKPRPTIEQEVFGGYGVPDSLTDPALLNLPNPSQPQGMVSPTTELEAYGGMVEPPVSAKSQKRKRRAEIDETQQAHEGAPQAKAKKRKSKKQKDDGQPESEHTASATQDQEKATSQAIESERPVTDTNNFRTIGAFTQPEIDRLGRAIEQFRDYNNLSQAQVNDMIQDTETKDVKTAELWADILASLPNRVRQSVYRFCRRRWHNYEKRGKWDPDEDEALKAAYHQMPDKWKDIGRMIGRMPDDARDRWRNYLKCGDNMRKDVWSDAEIHSLLVTVSGNLLDLTSRLPSADAQYWRDTLGLDPAVAGQKTWTNAEIREFMQQVPECLDALRDAKQTPNPSTQSSQQPSEHESIGDQIDWNVVSTKMGNRRSRLQCLMKWKALSKRFGKPEKAKEAKFDSWRFKSGNAAYDKMLPGDKYEIVRQIREMGVLEEERISWRAVCKRWPDEMWQPHHRKVALMRMKKLVEPQGGAQMSFPELLDALARHFESRYPDELGKRLVRERKDKKGKPKRKEAESNKLSKETVDEDDDGDVVMGGAEDGQVDAQAQAQAQAAAQAAAAAMAEAGELKVEDDGEVDDEGVGGVRQSVEVDSLLGARESGDDDDDDEESEDSE
ncbi:hypothetical protein K490DRAFT_56005 [Saccharata proteae CBS 121410]|uniref:DNA-binding protein REB1 n=1 Tax=Saccharata proteae CBS 121410 TaxID=1314787 RepID=A0A9P4HXK6_9PEZI|nr:hypothetical protein K490DRAFT_56005 [Saccharata proteae CBS 121410]